jgi:mannitol 2-dehydrogenase
MLEIQKLNAKSLSLFPGNVAIPAYDRSKLKTGIVHIGIGGFHRAHQAFYTDQILHNTDITEWGICGIALLDSDRRMIETLVSQDGLYTLLITEPDGTLKARIIGSITEYHFAPENQEAVLEKMAGPEVKIITLTITEGGYNFNSASGEFRLEEPSVQKDLYNPGKPITVFGYLAQALKRRRDRGIRGLTIQSCDNIQHNGDVMKKMLLAYVQAAEPGLTGWIRNEVTFPNSMIDRITPVTTQADREKIRTAYGIEDAWPVVCEPFIQWVIEDKYANGRPAWETVGVMLVKDVAPYEKMKIRLLNAGHSLLGFFGSLHGCSTIDETVRIPMFATFLRNFMDLEVTPLLGSFDDVNIEDYKDSLIQRFANQHIKDQLSRICLESSAKIPKFVLPTISENLGAGGEIKRGTVIVAAWCRYLELAGTPGHSYEINDAMKDELQNNAVASGRLDPLAFLKTEIIFGELVHSKRFVATYLQVMEGIRKFGVEKVIIDMDKSN